MKKNTNHKDVFEWMVKLGCMKRCDLDESKRNVISESQESKSIDAAKKLVMQKLGYSNEEADEFVRVTLRNDIPALRDKRTGKFILGVTRMFCDGQLRNATVINRVNTTLKYAASDTHINEYDRNLNGMSASEFVNQFAGAVSADYEKDRSDVASQQYQDNGQYTIMPIDSFEDAQRYSQYVDWCVTHYNNMFDRYTSEGVNQFYFCLKKGFENMEAQQGEGCPLDEYGLSMIAVCVDDRGALATATCRWNHDNGGNDHILNTKQISQIVGRNFYETFKPNNKLNEQKAEILDWMNKRNGMDFLNMCWSYFDCSFYGAEDVCVIKFKRNSPKFIVNLRTKQFMMGGRPIVSHSLVVDQDNKKYPYLIVSTTGDEYNIYDINQDRLVFENGVYDISLQFVDENTGKLYILADLNDDGTAFKVYSIPDGKEVLYIPMEYNTAYRQGPCSSILEIIYSFWDDNGHNWYLWSDAQLRDEEDTYAMISDRYDMYSPDDDDDYLDGYFYDDDE